VKALYLDGTRGIDVKLDGPALRVRRPGRSDGQYPLQRISRIITLGAVRWSADAIDACLSEQKPVAVLEGHGRFVRVLFRPSIPTYGLLRRFGALMDVPRFLARYERWLEAAEQIEMRESLRQLNIDCGCRHPDIVWQMVCFQQYRRWHTRVGFSYRCLLGLSAAQISSALSATGIPGNPLCWERQEYRMFSDMVRLERWKQAVLLDKLLQSRGGRPDLRSLIEAFEGTSDKRGRRIAAWQQRALIAMMGLYPAEEEAVCEQPEPQQYLLDRLCKAAGFLDGNIGRIPFGKKESIRSSIRILREYLKSDQRAYEYKTA
jgi:hypothetical protein